MNKKKDRGFDTKSIHSSDIESEYRSNTTPLIITSSHYFPSVVSAEDALALRSTDYVYARGRNPTIQVLENRIAELEEGESAVAFSSGMAAIFTSLIYSLRCGDEVLVHNEMYGSTYSMFKTLLPRFGINVCFLDFSDLTKLAENISNKTKAVFFETPTNPSLCLLDIESISKIAKEKGNKDMKVIVDNSLVTPYFQKPLVHGADIVVHSATKYISGHGDVLGGIAVLKTLEESDRLRFGYLCEIGNCISPFNAWILIRGTKTLGIRMRKHEENAEYVLKYFEKQPMVDKIYFPGFCSDRDNKIMKKQMSGVSGLISFELHGDAFVARNFVDNLKLHKISVSFGDVDSLVEIPKLMTHRSYENNVIPEKMIRISVGLEDKEDIVADLDYAFSRI